MGEVTTGCWVGEASRATAAWLSRPESGMSTIGVLVVPPLAYEYWSSHRTLRRLARALADVGAAALRLDLPGTANSAGHGFEPAQLQSWQRGVLDGVEALRAFGCTWVAVVGLRFGATLALTESGAAEADAVVAWFPVVTGRRYVRALRLLGTQPPETDSRPQATGALISGGVPLSAQTLGDIATIRLDSLPVIPAPDVLVLRKPEDREAEGLRDRLAASGAEVTLTEQPGADSMLDVSCERATIPLDAIRFITDWIVDRAPRAVTIASPTPRTLARLSWSGGEVVEEMAILAGSGLRAVVGRPAPPSDPRTVVVFLNPGSEPSVGPGRAWVEYARALNLAGYATVRLDFRGWGESPDSPLGRPGVAYDPHTVEDTLDAVMALEASGYRSVVLVGLCASSWTALRTATRHRLGGIFALNMPFVWRPGIPVNLTAAESEVYLADTMRRVQRAERFRLWSGLDAVGFPTKTGRWLGALDRTGTPIRLVYAAGDIGLRHLHSRHGRRLSRIVRAGNISLTEIPDIDHQMHREWLRPAVTRCLLDFVGAVDRAIHQ